jgi:hypothetical protein
MQLRVIGTIHVSHTAGAKMYGDLVASNLLANQIHVETLVCKPLLGAKSNKLNRREQNTYRAEVTFKAVAVGADMP